MLSIKRKQPFTHLDKDKISILPILHPLNLIQYLKKVMPVTYFPALPTCIGKLHGSITHIRLRRARKVYIKPLASYLKNIVPYLLQRCRTLALRGGYLWEAYLQGAYLQGAYLMEANFWRGYLQGANFRGADLREAKLEGAYLLEAEGLRVEQLCTAKTLYGASLDTWLEEQVKEKCHHLLEEPKDEK